MAAVVDPTPTYPADREADIALRDGSIAHVRPIRADTLLAQLAEAAAGNGVHTFEALAKPENRRMLDVFRQFGFRMQTHFTWDAVEVSFPTELTPEGLARFEQREEQSAA